MSKKCVDLYKTDHAHKLCLFLIKSETSRVYLYIFKRTCPVCIFIKAVPVPQDCVQEVKEMFTECAQAEGIELNEIPTHSDIKQVD